MSKGWNDRASAILIDAAKRAPDISVEMSMGMVRCQSPIEQDFLVALWALGAISGRVDVFVCGSPELLAAKARETRNALICPQMPVSRMHVDFLIALPTLIGDQGYLVVECDGHEFHEKTKEQAVRDKRRDRVLAAEGMRVIRYAGSEVFADPVGCALNTHEIMASMMYSSVELCRQMLLEGVNGGVQ